MCQVREKTEDFLWDYNHQHPHDSLNDMTPIEFLEEKHNKKPILTP
jgi:transposase InsO family protein